MEEEQENTPPAEPQVESKIEDIERIRELQGQVEQLQEELRAAKEPPPAEPQEKVQQYPRMLYHSSEVPLIATSPEEENHLASFGYTPKYEAERHKLN